MTICSVFWRIKDSRFKTFQEKETNRLRHTYCGSFNYWGERGCRKFVPVLGGDGTKIAPRGHI